jgi:hypothetical protein
MRKFLWLASTGLLLAGLAQAKAADLAAATPMMASPPATVSSGGNTFSVEFDAEFQEHKSSSKPAVGDVADYFGKYTLSHTFENNVVISGFLQTQYDLHPGKTNLWRYYSEGDIGYKAKLNDWFTLTPSAGIGGIWGDTGITKANPSAAYYAFYLAGDLKLNSNWTWNVFNARWRDAFNYNWQTPKVATGITYNISKWAALYGTVGYSWKETDTVSGPDKLNVGAGFKVNF